MEWEGSSPYSPEFKSLFTFDLALEPSRVWRSRLYNAICNRYLTILVPYHFGPYHFGWQNCGGHQFLQYHQCSFSPTRLVNNMHCHQNLLPVTCIVIKISKQHTFEKFWCEMIEHRHVLIAGICLKLTVVELRVLFREDQKVVI